MPVSQPRSTDPARIPLLQEIGRGPQAFLRYLQQSSGAVASARTRYRFVDFLDEACPISSEDGEGEATDNDHPSGSGEEDAGAMAVDEPQLLPESICMSLPGPSTCSYLSVGQSFVGTQRLSMAPARNTDDWQVVVRVQGVDMARGYACGVMEAMNVPQANEPIITFWEGEIIDNANHSFFTQGWGAGRDTDLKHWGKFPAFSQLEGEVQLYGGRSPQLSTCPCIFMRWKETFFVNSNEACGLTIAGFYYICMERQTGAITGFYFDPNSAPFQYLSLKPMSSPRGGMTFGSYELR